MSNSQTYAVLSAVKDLAKLTREWGASDFIPDLLRRERDYINILSDIQNGTCRTEPAEDEDAETVLYSLREHYGNAYTRGDMADALFRLEGLALVLNAAERVVTLYARDIEGKEGAQ